MATRVETTTLCDWHLEGEGVEVEGAKTHIIRLDGRKAREVDLCGECLVEVEKILRLGRKSD